MKKILILMIIFMYGCAGLMDEPSVEKEDSWTISVEGTISDIEVLTHRDNVRIKIFMPSPKYHAIEVKDSYFFITVSYVPVRVEQEFIKNFSPLSSSCKYTGLTEQRSVMVFQCESDAKIYPKVDKDHLDIVFTK